MGLDMFLNKKTYLSNYRTQENQDVKFADVILPVKSNRLSTITEEVGYWRKFNALHNWFVMNVQNGNDDCMEYCLEKEHIQELNRVSKLVYESLVDGPTKTIKTWSGCTIGGGQERIDHYDDETVYENTSVAEELLPTVDGFFFGDTEYSKDYLSDVKSLIQETEDFLKEMEEDEKKHVLTDWFYQSSW